MQTETNQMSDTFGESPADKARQQAQQAADQAKSSAQDATRQAKSRVRHEVDSRSTQAGALLQSSAADLRAVGGHLRTQGKDAPARLADQGAEKVEQLGRYLQESDADRILSDLEDRARQQPWAVIAGGVAIGFLGARFLRASSSKRYASRPAAEREELPARTPATGGPGSYASGPAASASTAGGVGALPPLDYRERRTGEV